MRSRLLAACTAIFFFVTTTASNELSLKDITGGKFMAQTIKAITPLNDGQSYAQISDDGMAVERFSFKTGKRIGEIFNIGSVKGETIERFDNYLLSPDEKKILIQTNTEYVYRRSFKANFYVYDIKDKTLKRLTSKGKEQNPIWSPDGKKVAFVRDNNIFYVDLESDSPEKQVTTDGNFNKVINGIPDWVNEEEFGLSSSMVFNADGSKINWIRYDETDVETYALQLFKGLKPEMKDYSDYPGEYAYKYPKAGHDNSIVTAWTYDIEKSTTSMLKLPLRKDSYIPRIRQVANPNKIVLYTMNRHQDSLSIYEADLTTTNCRLLICETIDKYVTEEAMSQITFTPQHIIMPSDRNGKMQLYLYDINGNFIKKLTDDDKIVTAFYGYDEKTGNVYYQAAGKNPMNREVYVTHKTGITEILAGNEGWNSAVFSKRFNYFIRIWSDANTPFNYAICKANGTILRTLVDNESLKNTLSEYSLSKKEFFSFTTTEGINLNGVMIKPQNFDASKKYPVVMYQYSGPGSQQVVNSWNIGSMGQGGMFDEYLTQKGFIVVCVDGRGTGARGAEFEKCTYLRLGELEAIDQAETGLYLSKLPYIDKERIGIWGWSFGGFCTLMSMSEGRDVFSAGVAVAPPTDWRYYDSIYTERFMRTPQENAEGYDINPINRADKLHGSLLICHGLADDNVHPQNTFEYSEALVQADKDFREIIYTNRNHSIRGANSRNHILRQVANHFIENFMK